MFSVNALASNSTEDGKKLSRSEFTSLTILPSGSSILNKGTELNVVVDVACYLDPQRGPQTLDWLRQQNRQIKKYRGAKSSRSVSWTLEKDWDFLELQQAFEQEPCVEMVSPEGRFFLSDQQGSRDRSGAEGNLRARKAPPASRALSLENSPRPIAPTDVGPASISDPLMKDQTHLSALHYSEAIREFWVSMLTRPDVTLAVIDTGVDFNHPDLKPNRWTNKKEIPANGIDDDHNGFVDDVDGYNFASDNAQTGPEGDWPDAKHGTHVAGLAAARIDNAGGGVGLDGVAKIMSLNVFGRNGYTKSSILENAIRYAADRNVDIINLSLGGREYSRTMRSALRYAIQSGAFMVTAAGNDGVELCDDPTSFDFISPAVYGAGIDGMIVTASFDAGTGDFSSFSNFSGRLVEIAAPGAFSSTGEITGLLSTTPNNTYGYLAGTSMAAPVVSGAAALAVTWLKAHGYGVTPSVLERILKESAQPNSRFERAVEKGRILDLLSLANYLKLRYPGRGTAPASISRGRLPSW
jgi:subtilisin family serine protease